MNVADKEGKGLGTLGSLTIVPMRGKQKVDKKKSTELLDLDTLGVTVESEEVIEQRIREAKERSQFAQRAAQLITQIRDRRKQLALIEEKGGTLTSLQKDELNELDRKEGQILFHGDEELHAQVQFALFIEDIRGAEPTQQIALALLDRAIGMERYRLATRDEIIAFRSGTASPAGAQFLGSFIYLSLFPGSPAQSALEAELRKYLKKVKDVMEREQDDEINAILRGGSHDLEHFRDGRAGIYVLHLPERKVSGQPIFYEGAALISLESKALSRGGEMMIIKIISGAGKLAWMNDHKGKWISFSSFKRDRSDANLSGDLLDFSNRFIRNLKAALSSWRERRNEKR